MRKNALALLLLLVVALPSDAARTITLPYAENFTTDTLADIRWTSCAGASVIYSTEGWSGGAVKLIPPTDPCASGNGGMSAIGMFQGFSTNRFNVRFLMKVGPTYAASHRGLIQNKFLDVWGANSDRQGILTLEYDTTGGAYFTPGVYPEPSNWTVFRSPGTVTEDHYHYNSPFKIFDGGVNSNVWVCYEYEINIAAGTATVTITKEDGTVATIYSVQSSPSSTITNFYLGGYYNGYSVANSGNWLLIDNLAVSNTTIGPPAGFVGGTTTRRATGGGTIAGSIH